MIIALISLITATAESLTYAGFFLKHVGIPTYLIYAAGLMLFSLVKSLPLLIRKLIFTGSIISTLALIILNLLEDLNYPNFVFTHLHINILTLQILVFLLGCYAALILLGRDSYLLRLSKSILIGGLITVGALGLGRSLGVLVNGALPVIQAPRATYDQKMTRAYPGFYPAIQLVKQITPPDASIIIPPQGNPWEMEGNGAIMNYFLYPRQIITTSVSGSFPLASVPKTYALIAKGSWVKSGEVDYGWPKIPLASTKIWQFNIDQHTTQEFARDYNPELDLWDWGLIEISP